MSDRLLSRRALFLRPDATPAPTALPMALVAPFCLAFRGTACMTCRDACEPGAIRFSLAIGGARPRVEADICTGCGECMPSCPASAISIVPRPMEETADA